MNAQFVKTMFIIFGMVFLFNINPLFLLLAVVLGPVIINKIRA